MPTTLRRVGFFLALALAIAYAYAPLWSAGNVGDDVPALVDATWGLERMIGALSGVADVDPFPK